MSFQTKKSQKVRAVVTSSTVPNPSPSLGPTASLEPLLCWQSFREEAQKKEKAVRIVSTGRQGRNPLWVSVEDEKSKSLDSGRLPAASAPPAGTSLHI